MNKLCLLLLALAISQVCISQNANPDTCLVCHKNPLKHLQETKACCPETTPVSANMRATIRDRQYNYSFHRTMRSIQDPSTVTSFTTWTFNNLGYDKKNFILDADVQIPISIGGKKFGLNELQVIPRFQVRIFRDDPKVPYGTQGDISLPVRTPSAMPGVAYYHSLRKWWLNEKSIIKFIGLYAYHHSNGQDGPELTTVNGHREVNVYNGNFSENVVFEPMIGGTIKLTTSAQALVRMMANNRKKISDNHPGKQIFIRVASEKEFYWKLSYELHPKILSNDIFDGLHMMGRKRINLRTGMLFLPTMMEYLGDGEMWCRIVPERPYERWRILANLSYILDGIYYRGDDIDNMEKIKFFNLNRRLNISFAGYRVIGHSGNASVFGSIGYYGSDPYNIYFNQSLWQFKLGLAFAFFNQPDEKDYF